MEHPKDATTRQTVPEQADRLVLFSKNFVAGGVAGAVSRTVVSPLERAKILFQVQNSASVTRRGQQGFDSLGATFQRIWKQEGVAGLFKGNGVNIMRIVPYSAMQFASYEFFLKWIASTSHGRVQTWQRLTAGGCAGVVAATFTYPLDLVRTRLSLATNGSAGIISSLRSVIAHEGGFFSLYRGLLPTLMGIAPLVAINFTVYEWLKQHARDLTCAQNVPVSIRLACGGIAGAVAQTVTYPLDVLRRRLQSSGLLGFNYNGVLDAAVRMYREEGILSFYRGMLPNYLKMVPAISVSFVVYEAVQSLLR